MIDRKRILHLLDDIESDLAERTISTTNTDKFGQAICAFANDLPNHNQSGYLIIGAEDDGNIKGLHVTDELLKNIAAIRTDGNIQPQPSMTVEKMTIEGKNMIVVEVQPANFPPVKYKGRIWVRVGPRKSVANEADEKILYEKRASNISTFDAMPCMGTTIDDLDTKSFLLGYLPQAFPLDVLESDKRDIKTRMQSLGFYDCRYDCPTYAGLLMFGLNLEHFLPGAYIQYVKFSGKGRGGEILSEHKFAGNLYNILPKLDSFIDTTISNRRPVPVSALREEIVLDYPYWATRELLMNAVCHRDYESNGPIQFYQYEDRIEILNPGGLYGKARPENFPLVNDYRNSVVAEAMKVMGFVNRFSRGVLRVQEELTENGNGEATFNLDLITAFLVTEKVSHKAEMIEFKPSEGQNVQLDVQLDKKEADNVQLNVQLGNDNYQQRLSMLTNLQKTVLEQIRIQPKSSYIAIGDAIGVNEKTIRRTVADLKAYGIIKRENGKQRDKWIIIDKQS